MLKPSKKAGMAPLIAEAKGGGGKPPVTKPNSPDSTRNRVIVSEASGAKHNATFTAPRKEGSMNPMECGYTKPGKG